nr:anaerobic sulfatase maturase [Burkholderiaceae bacterium]
MSSEPLKIVAPPRSTRHEEPTVALQPLPPGMKHRFHAMVKPVGSMCNLDCTYCYYLHKEELLGQPRQPRMADEMLERHIRQYIEAQTGDDVVFSW